jgi:MFS family permease
MLSQQIRSGVAGNVALLDSIDAMRNGRAVVLVLATFAIAASVAALAVSFAPTTPGLMLLFALLAVAVAFYGANAAGMMMMDEANGHPSRPIGAAVMSSIARSHRLILVLLIVAGIYLLGILTFTLLLFICKMPGIGPVLYTVVFPVSVILSGIAILAVPTVIFPLSAPAVWNGATAMGGVSQLIGVTRNRLPLIVLLMFGVGLIAWVVAGLIGLILLGGTFFMGLLSTAVLGSDAAGLQGITSGLLSGGGLGGSIADYATATMVGGGIVYAAALTLPGLVYLRGASAVYLRAIEGLDLVAAQEALRDRVAAAQARAQEFQARAQETAQRYAQRAHAPAPVLIGNPASLGAAAIATGVPAVTSTCPVCATVVDPGDVFCGTCGQRLV